MDTKRTILCVGTDLNLLTTRCEVLSSAGYSSEWAFADNFESRVKTKRFDLIILSVTLTRAEKDLVVKTLPTAIKVLDLDRLVFPPELFRLVEQNMPGEY